MTDFPELEKVSPRGIRKWAAKVKAWANAKRLVEPADKSISLEEFPTGTIISAAAGSGGNKNLYFVEAGLLKSGDFAVTNIV